MTSEFDAHYRYNQTIKLFGAEAEPAFEAPEEQAAVWGRRWGCDSDVGRLRLVLMHRPEAEMAVIDPAKRIEEIGAYGDPEAGWYWQSDVIPPLAEMQAQHNGLVAALRNEGVEVAFLDGAADGRIKSCYTRDSALAVKGGAVVCRMGPRLRRGEEAVASRTLAKLGVPILRTIHGTGMVEGGSFAWIDAKTAVLGRSIRVNEEGARQLEEVLAVQGVELIRVDLAGYDIHIDGAFVMIDVRLALIDPERLPYSFLKRLEALGVRVIEITPADSSWIVNCLAVRPGRVIMPEGASNRTLDLMAQHGVEVVAIPYDKMALNGGGIHCSTCPLIRDPVG